MHVFALALALSSALGADEVTRVKELPTTEGRPAPHYLANRAPLVPSRLLKLPIGAIAPQGLIRRLLDLEVEGMSGRLPEVSQWCKYEGNAWSDPTGQGHSGWEELPYWLKGFGDLGYVTGNERILAETKRWIEAILKTAAPDGWFGPRHARTSLDERGRKVADFWPHMLILNILQSHYERTSDARVLPFMTNYFRWQLAYPAADFMGGYWPKMRAGDNLESVLWLYNRTGEAWLLDLARKLHASAAPWSKGVANWHGVNFCQGFREPAMFWLLSGDPADLQASVRNYDTAIRTYGQVPGGMFGADENARPKMDDPRQAAETCSMVEFMHSFELLARFTGDPLWADRCEEVAWNSLTAALTPDLKALKYLTAPNQIQLDHANKAPAVQNGGCMFAFSPGGVYRCCQHNVAMGWPYYAEEMWAATADRGLATLLYQGSSVTAKVGDGATVTIVETTDYPFSDTVTLRVKGTARFPLYLRVPRWSGVPELTVNGRKLAAAAEPSTWLRVERAWADGDSLTVRFPMTIKVRRWEHNKHAASVDRGPLTYSLKIEEDWRRSGGTDAWPEWDVLPKSPWNYGLVLDERDPTAGLTVSVKPGPLADQPFTPDTVPLSIRAKARRLPNWVADKNNCVTVLQPSPVKSDQPTVDVTLIPMGAARLRISAFPVIGAGPDAREWNAPPPPAAVTASHCFGGDDVDAVADGQEPKSSNDHGIPRMTWWDHRGSDEWIARRLAKPRTVSATAVYWFDDTGRGQCRVPKAWRVLYQGADGRWQPVSPTGEAGVKPDQYNRLAFKPVEASALKIEVTLQAGFSGGILEWKIE